MRKLGAVLLIGCLGWLPAVAAQDNSRYSGTIDDANPFDEYTVSVPQDGQLTLDMQATGAATLDGVLYLLNSDGDILLQNDDRLPNQDLNPSIIAPNLDAGDYTVIATRPKVTRGKSTGDYTLAVTVSATTPSLPSYDVSAAALQAAGYPADAPRAEAAWTILAYYGADTNLENGILADVREFEQAGGSTDDVNIVLLLDRSPAPDNAQDDWTGARVFRLEAAKTDDPFTPESPALFELGDVNTGDGLTLAQFLVWGMHNFPAQKYTVAFGSHGAGWGGIIQDDSSDKDHITLPELRQAFDLALAANDGERMALLINDACLMASMEYFSLVARYFDYTLASAEIVNNPALDMGLLTQTLNDPAASAGDFLKDAGQQLINTYLERDMAARSTADRFLMTHALIDLAAFADVEAAVNAFASLLNSDMPRYATALGQARNNTRSYATDEERIDLGGLMEQLSLFSSDADLLAAARRVREALDDARLYGDVLPDGVPSTFYNIYFPQERKRFDNAYNTQTTLTAWALMLRNYFNVYELQEWRIEGQIPFHLSIEPQIAITSAYPTEGALSVNTPISVQLDINGRKIADGRFVVDEVLSDGTRQRLLDAPIVKYRIGASDEYEATTSLNPGLDQVTASWETYLPTLAFDEAPTQVALRFDDAEYQRGVLDARFRNTPDAPWQDVALLMSRNAQDGSYQTDLILSRNPETPSVAPIDIPSGAEFQVYRQLVQDDGSTLSVADESADPLYAWPEGGLRLAWSPATDGDYEVGYSVRSFGGTSSFTNLPVRVANSGVAAGRIGTSDVDLGFSVALPAEWGLLSSTDQVTYVAAYPTGENALWIDVQQDDSALATFQTVLSTWADGIGVVVDASTLREDSVAGRDVLRFAGDQGQGFIAQSPSARYIGTVYLIFFAPVQAEGLPAPEAVLAEVEANLQWFNVDDQSRWVQRQVGYFEESFVPVPADWTNNDVAIWTTFGPADDFTTSFSITQVKGRDANAVLKALLADYVISGDGATDYQEVQRRTYYGEYYTWEVVLYTVTYRGETVTGRIYVTTTDTGYAYALWMETPQDEDVDTVFVDTFELMVDGFTIPVAQRTFRDPEGDWALRYPREWYLMEYNAEYEAYFTQNLDQQVAFFAYAISEVKQTDAVGVGQAFLAKFPQDNMTLTSEDFAPVSYGGVEGVEFSYAFGDAFEYTGYGLAVWDAEENTGTVFAVIAYTSAEIQEAFNAYSFIIGRDLRFTAGAAQATSTSAYEAPTSSYGFDGFSFNAPEAWSDFILVNNDDGAERYEAASPSGQTWVAVALTPSYLLDIDGITTLEEARYAPDGEPEALMLAGRPALRYAVATEEGYAGEAVTFFMPETQQVVSVAVLASGFGDVAYHSPSILDSIAFEVAADYNPERLNADFVLFADAPTLVPDVIDVTLPAEFAPFVYDDEAGWFYAYNTSDEATADMFIYPYLIEGDSVTLEELARAISYENFGRLDLENPQVIQIGGLNALSFESYYTLNESEYAVFAYALSLGDYGVLISIEGTPPYNDLMLALDVALCDNLYFPPFTPADAELGCFIFE